jgi:predicted nuclease of predicted toxin-antitoxin system
VKFLLDESVDSRLAIYLAIQAHDVTVIARDYPSALSDQDVLALSRREDRILITNDQDFGELVFREGLAHSGVILFRLRTTRLNEVQARLQYVLTHHAHRLSEFIVATDERVRVRPTHSGLK